MAIAEWDRNLFTSDPTLFAPAGAGEYERAARALAAIADPVRLRLLHALSLGEDTPQRAALWSGISQVRTTRELAALIDAGVVLRAGDGLRYVVRDGHHVAQLHVALAHGREGAQRHPRMLTRRRMPAARQVG